MSMIIDGTNGATFPDTSTQAKAGLVAGGTIATGTITTLTAPTSTITTLNAPSGVLATQNGMTGIAKAWVYFNGSTATINGSFNVSSVTRSGTGLYTANFTTAMPNTNFSALASAGDPSTTTANSAMTFIGQPTTTSQFVATRNGGNASVDENTVNIVIFST